MPLSCDIRLPLSWSWIESVRKKVADTLRDYEPTVREAAIMVASELAENVVKYGEPVDSCDFGRILLVVEDGSIRILSSNGVQSEARVLRLAEQLSELASSTDPEALYLARVREVLANPKVGDTQMGFYRIVCEGGYRLSHSYDEGILTITAERSV